jgi:hypothetical protein
MIICASNDLLRIASFNLTAVCIRRTLFGFRPMYGSLLPLTAAGDTGCLGDAASSNVTCAAV